MELLLLYVAIIASAPSLTSAVVSCDLSDRSDCRYTVTCEHFAGQAWSPNCDYDPYVTFVLKSSTVESLTAGFFGSTNFDGRVRVFSAQGNSWNNIESLTFRFYSKTVLMDISNNSIESISDGAFHNLVNLERLNISGNKIKRLGEQVFMISESRKSDLEVLDLSNNVITDVSADFGYLPFLKELYLHNNRISQMADNILSMANRLKILNLSNNNLNALNMTFLNLKALQILDLSYNKVNEVVSYELNRLTALEKLNMSHNIIRTFDTSFENAPNLTSVDLSYNKIETKISTQMFSNNDQLYYLNLYENNITKIEDDAFKVTPLQYLNLERNNLTGEITDGMFLGLSNITSLNLSNQSITAIRKNAFNNAVALVYLNISMNKIQVIDNSSFTDAQSLNILDISYNNVTNLNFIIDLSNLTELYLSHNRITEIPLKPFLNKILLKKLDLNGNMIQNIVQNSLPLQSLQYINVSDNSLVGVLKRNVFSPAKYLRYLDLTYFNLTKIDEMALVDLPLLARINISHNALEEIHPNNFIGMRNMFSLDLSYNKLQCFHLNNVTLINLKALYLNNNNLSNISRTLITNLTGLLYLDLSYNNISDLSDVPFSALTNLTALLLSHNNIKYFNTPHINTLIKLNSLSLSGNQLKYVNLTYFKNLMSVDLSKNSMSFINASLFADLDYLQSLDVSGNSITQIVPGTFRYVKNLKLLNLSHNKLTELRYGTFRGLNRTSTLNISYNEISDIDVHVFHECYGLTLLTIDYNKLKTLDMEQLVNVLPNLLYLSLGGNPISCREIVRNIKTVNDKRQVEVSSIHKVFHEDNVHGILCGDVNTTFTTAKAAVVTDKPSEASSTSTGLIVWCTLLTVMILCGAGFLYYRRITSTRPSRLQMTHSISDFPSSLSRQDLLH